MRFACVDAIGCGQERYAKAPLGEQTEISDTLKRANHMSVPILLNFGYKKLRSDKAVKLLYLDSLG